MWYLLENHYDIVKESIIQSEDFKNRIAKVVHKNLQTKELDTKAAASLILYKADLSQRGYINVKSILKKQNIILPTYDSVQMFLKNLDIGKIE